MKKDSNREEGEVGRLVGDAKRFLGAGLTNTLITFAAYQLLLFVLPATASYAVTWIIGLAFVALVYPSYVFKGGDDSLSGRAYVVGVYIISFGIGVLTIYALDNAFGVKRISIVIALIATTVFNFLAMGAVLRGRRKPRIGMQTKA
jgi:hypothetical protein